MRIAVYPGSFDPLHIGHLAIMEYLTNEKNFDWVYLVISPQNPFKSPEKALSAEKRYEAAIEAVKRHPDLHVWVDNIELNMPQPNYTINTLDELKKREPENEFTLIIGADNLQGFHKWNEAKRILSDYGVAVYPRVGFDPYKIKEELVREFKHIRNIQIIDAPIIDISSTEIRKGGEEMSEYLM